MDPARRRYYRWLFGIAALYDLVLGVMFLFFGRATFDALGIEEKFPERFFHVPDLQVTLDRDWKRLRLDGTLSLSPIGESERKGLGLEGVTLLEQGADPVGLTALSAGGGHP